MASLFSWNIYSNNSYLCFFNTSGGHDSQTGSLSFWYGHISKPFFYFVWQKGTDRHRGQTIVLQVSRGWGLIIPIFFRSWSVSVEDINIEEGWLNLSKGRKSQENPFCVAGHSIPRISQKDREAPTEGPGHNKKDIPLLKSYVLSGWFKRNRDEKWRCRMSNSCLKENFGVCEIAGSDKVKFNIVYTVLLM